MSGPGSARQGFLNPQWIEVASARRNAPLGYPGAWRLDPSSLEGVATYFPHYHSAGDARLLEPQLLRQRLGQLGISAQSPVRLYGAGWNFPVGTARVAWALLAAGVEDVDCLDGGIAGLSGLGPLRSAPASLPFGCYRDCWWKKVARAEDCLRPGVTLVDIRSYPEYSGQKSDTYPFFRSTGHLPGALWGGNWTSMLGPDRRRFLALETVRKRWQRRGISADCDLIFYCGTGWRSSLACWLARRLGFPRVRNYDGGVYDWLESGGALERTGAQIRPPKPL